MHVSQPHNPLRPATRLAPPGQGGWLRDGTWLTRERLRVIPAMLAAALALAIVALFATAHGLKDLWDRPLGTDFCGVWTAGRAVLAGHPAQPYDQGLHAAAQAAVFGPADSYLPWSYPPMALALAALLATMPYLVALAVWQGTTLALYAAIVLRAARGAGLGWRDVLVPALAFPAVAITVLHGQNGFLSAALLCGGALLVDRAPVRAGILLGLLAFKPQLALVVPVALLAGRHWTAILAAMATVLVAGAVSLVAFGPAPWSAFVADLAFTRHAALEAGGVEMWKLQSAFAAVRLMGGSIGLAYAIQALVACAAMAGLAWLYAGRADSRLKLAGLVCASLLATPYAFDYDMPMLGPAGAALVAYGRERGFPPYAKSLLAFVWIAPLCARTFAHLTDVSLGLVAIAALFGLVLVTARAGGAGAARLGDCGRCHASLTPSPGGSSRWNRPRRRASGRSTHAGRGDRQRSLATPFPICAMAPLLRFGQLKTFVATRAFHATLSEIVRFRRVPGRPAAGLGAGSNQIFGLLRDLASVTS